MTNESKINLLKALLNMPNENPNQNIPNFIDMGSVNNNIGDLVETSDFAKFRGTPYRVFQRNGHVFGYNENIVIHIYGSNVNVVRLNNSTNNFRLIDVFQDNEGIYGLIVENSAVRLAYFNDWSVPEADGEYYIRRKISYNINSILSTVTGDSSPQSCVCGQLKINKSPIDGRFLIFTSLSNQNYFSAIEYRVNVGSENTYEYARLSNSSFTLSLPKIDDMFVSWTSDSFSFSAGIIGTSAVTQITGNEILYEIKGDLSGLNYVILDRISNCVLAPFNLITANTPQIRYLTIDDRFISYTTANTVLSDDWYGGEIVLKRIQGVIENVLKTTSCDFVKDSNGNTYKNENNIIISDNNIFTIETKLISSTEIQVELGILIDDIINSSLIISNLNYVRNDSLSFSFIKNVYNLYDFSFQLDNNLYNIRAVYRPNGYNGEKYFSDKSITSTSGIAYNPSNIPIFARDLYNKIKVGNTIKSVLHIPQNILSDEIIINKDLISLTNSNVDIDIKEIDKSKYEELYLNFIDSFKIYDNNNNNNLLKELATNNLVNNIFTGNFNFKSINYRIYYEDDTYLDRPINHVTLNNNIATLEIYFSLENKKAKYLEVFDENYINSYAIINLSNLDFGIYKLTEYVKVE